MSYGQGSFANSERDSNGVPKQRYEKAALFITTKEQDNLMKETAFKTTATDYKTFLDNCVDNVEATFKIGGFKTGSGNGMDPSGKFEEIKNKNPKNYDISVFLKPKKDEKN